jgi:hypothetical protein
MAHDIHRAEARAQLPVHIYEPYWRTLDRGQAIGFRKIAADRGYWVARRRPDGELRLVEPRPYERGKSKRRELYLSLAQRRAL